MHDLCSSLRHNELIDSLPGLFLNKTELSEEQLTAGGSEGPYKKVQRIANIEAKAMSDLSGISTPLKLTTSTDNIFSDRPKKREKRKGKGQSKDTED